MSQAHNTIIRGLNAIVQQAPYVPDAAHDGFNATDVKDLLFFVQSWAKMVHHHHWVEETYLFPEVERFSGQPGLMDDPKHQHELFHDGMEKLLEYSSSTGPEEYRWEGAGGMKQIIDSFSKDLTDHLYVEIDLILGLGDLDGPGLKKAWKEAENIAKQSGNIGMMVSPRPTCPYFYHGGAADQGNPQYDVFPCVLGSADKTYEGGNEFPPLPFVLPYVLKYWFASGNGAWRFCPCDWWGQPRPLAFGPSESK